MQINIITLVALAATAAGKSVFWTSQNILILIRTGLTVTSPRMGEKIDPDQPLTIKWQSVE